MLDDSVATRFEFIYLLPKLVDSEILARSWYWCCFAGSEFAGTAGTENVGLKMAAFCADPFSAGNGAFQDAVYDAITVGGESHLIHL